MSVSELSRNSPICGIEWPRRNHCRRPSISLGDEGDREGKHYQYCHYSLHSAPLVCEISAMDMAAFIYSIRRTIVSTNLFESGTAHRVCDDAILSAVCPIVH